MSVWDSLADLLEPPPRVKVWEPQPKQERAAEILEGVFEMLYGGAAGGGKSMFIRCDSVEFALDHAGAHIGIVRRTLPMLKQTHMAPLNELTRGLAIPNRTESTWTFPNNSVIRFISLQHEGDEQNYKSVEFDRLYFDEVTELTEDQYTYMLSRLRSANGHPTAAVATANPEGVGFAWVKRRWVTPRPSDLGDGQSAPVEYIPWEPPLPGGGGFQRPRVFIPATVYDNPILLRTNPDYIRQLESIPDSRKRRALLMGDWTAMDQVPGALWKMSELDAHRVASPLPSRFRDILVRVVVAVDPAGTSNRTSDDTGIVVAGKGPGHTPEYFILADRTYTPPSRYDAKLTPDQWARRAIQAYLDFEADCIVYESNFGNEMALNTLTGAAKAMRDEGVLDHTPKFEKVTATRGKLVRAQPITVPYDAGKVHHSGTFDLLEEQMTTWLPESGESPDRMDALVWAMTYLIGGKSKALVSFS